MSDELHAIIGRKQVALEKMSAEADRAFWLIAEFSKGKIKPEEVTVDLAGRSWSYVPSIPVDDNGKVIE